MSINRICRIVSAALAVSAFYFIASGPAPLHAQTASNLVCSGCVGTSDLANQSVNSAKIKNNSIHNLDIINGTIKEEDLQNASVTTNKIRNGSIHNIDIKDGTITGADLAAAAKPAGADFDEESNAAFGLSIIPLTSTDTTVRFVNLTVPAAGMVIANASGFFDHSGGAKSTGRCELTTATAIDVLYGKTVIYIDGESGDETMIALTRGFTVTGPGTIRYRLICDRYSGPGDLDIVNPSLTVFYVPQHY